MRRVCFRTLFAAVLLHGDIVRAPCDVFRAERSNLACTVSSLALCGVSQVAARRELALHAAGGTTGLTFFGGRALSATAASGHAACFRAMLCVLCSLYSADRCALTGTCRACDF